MSVSDQGIELEMNFKDPIKVSKYDSPAFLLIEMDLSELKTIEGQSLSAEVLLKKSIPT